MVDLERKLRDAVLDGRPISHRPWRKILIIVEGIYRSAVSTPEFLFSVHSITAFCKISYLQASAGYQKLACKIITYRVI